MAEGIIAGDFGIYVGERELLLPISLGHRRLRCGRI